MHISWAEKRFDVAPFIPGRLARRDVIERQIEVEHLPRLDLPVRDQVDEPGHLGFGIVR
jgi:hypothetical protein